MTGPRWYTEDLFGEPSIPREGRVLRRNSRGYWAYLDSLPLPDGLFVWCLAEPPSEGIPPYVESVWCADRHGHFRRFLFDLRTGPEHDPPREVGS
jgi:hypothetical protein